MQQAQRFGTRLYILWEAERVVPGDTCHRVHLSEGNEVTSPAVVIATGVSYRQLDVPGIDQFSGRGVYYGAAVSEAATVEGQPVLVVGGGNSAGQAAVHLARSASEVTLVVRGEALAASMSEYLVRELDETPNITVRFGTEVARCGGERSLERVTLRDRASGATRAVPAAALFVLIGGRPRTDWLDPAIACDSGGYVLTGPDVPADTPSKPRYPFETSVPASSPSATCATAP